MSVRDVTVGGVSDAVSWLRDAAAASRTPPGSPERAAKLGEVARAVIRMRQAAEDYDGKMAAEVRLSARILELGIGYVATRVGRTSDVEGSGSTPRSPRKRRHPRAISGPGR